MKVNVKLKCLDIQNLMVLPLSRSYWRNCYIKTEVYKPCKMPDSEQKISTQDRDEVNSPDDCEWNSQNKSQQSGLSSVAQSCPTLCDPTNHSTPGLPVHHQLPEFTQTQVHRVSDVIQPSHPLSSPSPPSHNPSQSESFPMSQLFA